METNYYLKNGNGFNQFPRKLTEKEKYLLYSILPENKPGYKIYKDKIESLYVIAMGKFGEGNLILGKENSIYDYSTPSSPILAVGVVCSEDQFYDISIQEEMDDEIEIDISVIKNVTGDILNIKSLNYSDWNPGDKAPGDNSFVREVVFLPDKFIIAFAPVHKKIWIHNLENKINYLIPLSNFYNHLMLVKKIRDPKIALQPNLFFSKLDSFENVDLKAAFLLYNKYFRRINFDYSQFQTQQSQIKKNSLFSFFKKG
ncbi:MAG: hypothetical protein ACYDA4_13780 [Ignavibacteriaceae bacterium]